METAIELYREKKYAESATLAGASEEILGSFVRLQGGEADLDSTAASVSKIHERLTGRPLPKKYAKRVINFTKNSLKHLDGEDDATIQVDLEDEAKALLWRAVHNYDQLDMPYNAIIAGFPGNVADV